MTVLRVRGFRLPDGEPIDLYADGDRWTTDPVAGAELVAEGWLLPGLVDAHTHPGAEAPGQPLDPDVLRDDLRAHLVAEIRALVDAGVSPHAALASASWTARSYLGLPGLVAGAPADVVVFDADPRTDLGQLDRPRAVIVRGELAGSPRPARPAA